MSANIIESFFVSLGFEIDTGKLDEFEQKLAGARSTVLAVGAVAAAAAGAIGMFITKVATGVDKLGDFAEREQVSIEALQELGHAAQISGSSLDAVKSSVSSVNKTIGEAVLGIGRGAMTFQKLGMSAKNADGSIKTFDQLLEEVAGKMDGMSRQEAIAMAEKLGIDRSLIPMLLKGKEHIAALREEARELGRVSEEDAEKAGLFTDAMDRTRFMLAAVARGIAINLMPAMTGMLDEMRKWLLANREIIKSSITKFVQVFTALLGTLWDWMVRIAGGLFDLVKRIFEFKTATYLAIAAVGALISLGAFQFFVGLASLIAKTTARMAAFNATALLIPAIIGAIILAIGLLIDDYVNWKEGNDSVIGGLVDQFPALLGIIKTIEEGVGSFIDFWLQQWDTLKGPLSSLAGAIWNLVTTVVGALWPVVKMVFTGWAHILAAVIPIVATLIEWIAGFLVGAIRFVVGALTWIVQAATAVFQGVVAVVQFAIDAIVAYFTWWWQTTVQIFQFIVGIIGQVVDAVMGGVKGAVDWVMGIIDAAQQKVMSFINTVAGAIGKVGALLGLTSSAKDIKVEVSKSGPVPQSPANQEQPDPARRRRGQMTPIAQAVAQSPAMQNVPVDSSAPTPTVPTPQQQGGVIGRAGNTTNSSTVTQTTTIQAPITVNSPDPAKAGQAVRHELDKMHKQTTRNGQSAVAL